MAEYEERTTRTTTTTSTDPYDRSARTATYVERPRDLDEEERIARQRHHAVGHKNVLDWLALVLLIAGGLNWGLVGLFGIDVVSSIFGPGSTISRVIYIAIGVAGIWGFALSRLGPTRRY